LAKDLLVWQEPELGGGLVAETENGAYRAGTTPFGAFGASFRSARDPLSMLASRWANSKRWNRRKLCASSITAKTAKAATFVARRIRQVGKVSCPSALRRHHDGRRQLVVAAPCHRARAARPAARERGSCCPRRIERQSLPASIQAWLYLSICVSASAATLTPSWYRRYQLTVSRIESG
jgi:uncharacterized ParB-like nuclease family protein